MLIVGEKINGTIEDVKDAIDRRDDGHIAALASSQAEAGADYIDVNVGTGSGDSEWESMQWAVGVVRDTTDRSLALDSSDPEVLKSCLERYGDLEPLINSVNGEGSRLKKVLPLVALHRCPVVALAMDDSGIPDTPHGRLEVCRRILAEAESLDIPFEKVFIDPLVMPISADWRQGRLTLETLSLVKREFPGVKTILGLSNVSFGLPRRSPVNASMLAVAAYIGLDAVLMDPTDGMLRASVFAAEAVFGNDRYCKGFMKAFRTGLID